MASHIDFYEDEPDSLTHNQAPAFPQVPTGDSWVGALCSRHKARARTLFAGCVGVRCTNKACPAECCVCNGEYASRDDVSSVA
jgi:hypothetical protein